MQLTVLPLEETIDVEPGETMLEACLRNGIWLPYACNHGRCGTCKLSVIDGEVDHGPASAFALMDIERMDGKALACCATLKSDTTVEADVEDDDDAAHHPIRNFTARVIAADMLTPTIRRLELQIPDDFLFQAGQYVDLDLPGIGTRAFSIANPPERRGVIELHVRLVENGAGTTFLHRTKLGDELRVRGPLGRFFVRKSRTQPMIFIAGGSGLSSIESMVLDLPPDAPVTIFHGVRNPDELYHSDRFGGLFRYIAVTSGHVHEAVEREYGGKLAGNTAYLCGPPAMIEACIRVLMRGRLFEKDIFTERFVTQGDGATALAKSPVFKRI